MIYIKDNKTQIPCVERNIGVSGTNKFFIRQFAIPQNSIAHDLKNFTFTIKLKPLNESKAYYDWLSKDILDGNIVLTWVIKKCNASIPGKLAFSICMTSPDSSIYNETSPDFFVIEDGLETDESFPPPSIFETAVHEATIQANRAKSEADRAAELAQLVADMLKLIEDKFPSENPDIGGE